MEDEKTCLMSRHRTTQKMRRVSDTQAEANPAKTAIDAAASDEPARENGAAADELGDKSDSLTVESLGRYLATEASLREESEQRTSTVLSRYLKLTLVMACLNMVVAGVSVAALVASKRVQPVVITPPAPAPAPVLPPPQPAPPAVVVQPPAPPSPPAPPPAVSPPERIPLLGPLPAPKPKHAPGPTRATRLASKPLPPVPAAVVLARTAYEEDESAAHREVERW
jgi:hypothetical protein